MSETYDKLKAMLDEKGTLSDEDIKKVSDEHGAMPEEEMWKLQAEMHEKKRASEATVTMEQYLEATKVLDTEPEDSEKYKEAEKIVERFENAM